MWRKSPQQESVMGTRLTHFVGTLQYINPEITQLQTRQIVPL